MKYTGIPSQNVIRWRGSSSVYLLDIRTSSSLVCSGLSNTIPSLSRTCRHLMMYKWRGCFCWHALPLEAQCAWQTVPPPLTQEFAAGPDRAVSRCLAGFLSSSAALQLLALARDQLALPHAGVGLRSAVGFRAPAAGLGVSLHL